MARRSRAGGGANVLPCETTLGTSRISALAAIEQFVDLLSLWIDVAAEEVADTFV